jgi:hypothetical protein
MGGSFTLPNGANYNFYINKTGAASIKGTLVMLSASTDDAVDVCSAGAEDPIGVIYDSGVADGSLVRVIKHGKAQVLLQDGTGSTRKNWVKVSDTQAGRADATNALPPGGTVQALEEHLREVGHAAESVSSGTDVLMWLECHFN